MNPPERFTPRSRRRLGAALIGMVVLSVMALGSPVSADHGRTDVEVKKEARSSVIEIGQEARFDITVVNRGPNTAVGVVLTDTLPAGVDWEWDRPCSLDGNILTCVVGDLAPGEFWQLTLKGTPTECGVLENTAKIRWRNEPTVPPGKQFPDTATATISVEGCPLEENGEGCTPGFWKQSHHFDSWTGYATTDTLQSVFGPNALAGTLLDGLNFGGGPGVDGAKRILLRAAVSSLLNAASPDVSFGLTEGEVISQVMDALASGDRSTMLALASELDARNNEGCPLG